MLLLVAQQPPSARDHLQRGAAHLQRQEKEAAIRELRRAVALDPRSPAAHLLLGQAYLAQGAFEMMAEAKAELQQALDLDPNLLWARFYLAKIYLDLGRLDRAQDELERGLRIRPDVPHFLSLLGEVQRRLGHPDLAIQLNRQALQVDPAMTPSHYHIALARLDLHQESEALQDLEKALASQYVTPEMYVTLGSIYAGRQDLPAAATQFRKAIALDPARPEAHLRLAGIYRLQRAYDPALAELRLASLEGKPFLSSVYFQKLQADIFFETGQVYQDQGKTSQAVQAYRRVLDIDPGHDPARRRLTGLETR